MKYNSFFEWLTANIKYLGVALRFDQSDLPNKEAGDKFANLKNWFTYFGIGTIAILTALVLVVINKKKLQRMFNNFFTD